MSEVLFKGDKSLKQVSPTLFYNEKLFSKTKRKYDSRPKLCHFVLSLVFFLVFCQPIFLHFFCSIFTVVILFSSNLSWNEQKVNWRREKRSFQKHFTDQKLISFFSWQKKGIFCFVRIVLIQFFFLFSDKKFTEGRQKGGNLCTLSSLSVLKLCIVFPAVREIEIDRYKQLLSTSSISCLQRDEWETKRKVEVCVADEIVPGYKVEGEKHFPKLNWLIRQNKRQICN